MSQLFKRTITITSDPSNFTTDPTLLLTFQKLQGIDAEQYSVCWKTITFTRHNPMTLSATYQSQLCFISPQVDSGNVITPSVWQDIGLGNSTTISLDSQGTPSFSDPESAEPGYIESLNSTGKIRNIAVGIDPPGADAPTPLLYFPNVGDGSSVKAAFTPTLMAYISSNYQQSEIIKGDIQTPVIWKQNLAKLGPTTHLSLQYDGSTGHYTLTPA